MRGFLILAPKRVPKRVNELWCLVIPAAYILFAILSLISDNVCIILRLYIRVPKRQRQLTLILGCLKTMSLQDNEDFLNNDMPCIALLPSFVNPFKT
jgi:tryptophan 2,3-dioxygenase